MQISVDAVDKVEVFVDGKGRSYKIGMKQNNLYGIEAEGVGTQPEIANESFTGYTKAKKALEEHLRVNDRVGYADYPSKPREKVRPRVEPKET